MSKPIYINVFLNDKFSDITEAMYQKRDQISQETGRNAPPYLSNNKFIPQETITLRANQQYQVSFWFNEKEGKRSASISIKESEGDYQGGGGYRKSSGKDYKAKSIGEDTSVFGQSKDDEIPF
tara:strand:+ start:794 stop:1162 length:369 start_codon:yes stop_codon:yes gene_type:complete